MSEQEAPKAEGVVQAATATKQTAPKQISPEQFVTEWPLYTPAPVEGFYPPDRLSYQCDRCLKETTWLRMGTPQYQNLEGISGGYNSVWYLCGLCNKNHLIVMYRTVATEQRRSRQRTSGITVRSTPPATVTVVTKVQKIGQFPAQSIDIPKGLVKSLGEEAISLYKKALINRNAGYGLGAVTYIRRVVEDKTNELIEVAAKLAESHSVDASIVKQIRNATVERTTYDQKLKLAATVLPESLLIDGVNPLYELYNLVSEGIHGLCEEDCIAVADETASVFEFIFTNLRATTKARHDFVDKVKKWAGTRGPTQKENAAQVPE
jgi:hypothetical protein